MICINRLKTSLSQLEKLRLREEAVNGHNVMKGVQWRFCTETDNIDNIGLFSILNVYYQRILKPS